MFKLTRLCLAALLSLQLPASAAQAAPLAAHVDSSLADRIDAAIAAQFKATAPGATLIVTKEGKTLLRRAYGMADLASKTAMRPETSLRLGSLTKQFTAVAILMLAEEGKLSLSDPLSKHFPDYPPHAKGVTIEHLLTHTSGIVSYTSKLAYLGDMNKDVSVAQMIDTFKNDPLQFKPGERFAYNNSGYFLLGALIEKLSGQTYAQFLATRIFIPLKMDHTAYEGVERTPGLRATGYSKTESDYAPAAPLSMTQPFAAGSLVSTVDDLARWDAAITDGKLLKPASWKRAFTSYKLADGTLTQYGYGWKIGSLRGSPMVHHGGGINGFSTYALRLPEQRVYVAILTNTDGGMVSPEVLSKVAAAQAIGRPFSPFKAITLDPAMLDAYAGTYKIDDKTTRTVRRDKDRLVMQRTGRGPSVLAAFAPDTFFIKDSLASFKFNRDAKGAVVSMTIHEDDDSEQICPRTGDAPPERATITLPQATLDGYAGRFELAPGFVLEIGREA